MKQSELEAIYESIQTWKRYAQFPGTFDSDEHDCALCDWAEQQVDDAECDVCPFKTRLGKTCYQDPDGYDKAWENEVFNLPKVREAALHVIWDLCCMLPEDDDEPTD